VVSVHIEVRPKYLVPDTNCFIDHLDRITAITSSHVYVLMVPIVGKLPREKSRKKIGIVRAPVASALTSTEARTHLHFSFNFVTALRNSSFCSIAAVLSELEGLSRGGKSPTPSTRSALDPQHVRKVAQAAKRALVYLKSKPPAVKCVTTKGAVLSSTTFTTEDDSMMDATFKNDDKILATCLVLSKGHREQHAVESEYPEGRGWRVVGGREASTEA
jgi:protein SMG6